MFSRKKFMAILSDQVGSEASNLGWSSWKIMQSSPYSYSTYVNNSNTPLKYLEEKIKICRIFVDLFQLK